MGVALDIQARCIRAGRSFVFKLRDVRGAFTNVTGDATCGRNTEGTRGGHSPQSACQHDTENTWRRGLEDDKRAQGKVISGATSFLGFMTYRSRSVLAAVSQ